MKKIFFLFIVAFVLVVGAYLFTHWTGGNDLSVRPPKAATKAGAPLTRASVAIVKAFVPYVALKTAVENAFLKQYNASGDGSTMTHPIGSFLGPGPGVPIGYRWSILAERGDVTISGKDNKLHVDVPISISGWGGLRGDGAMLVGLDRKNFRGKVAVSLDLDADVDEDWKPVLRPRSNYSWTEPAQIEVTGGTWVDVTGQIDGPLKKALQDAADAAVKSIDLQAIRKAVEPYWRSRQLRFTSNSGYTVLATITPTGAGFSRLSLEPDGASFILLARSTTQTVVSASEVDDSLGPQLPLPKLERVSDDHLETILDLPVLIRYDALRSAAMATRPANGYSASTPLGQSTIKIENLEVYPTSNNRLAIGLKVNAKFERRMLDTRGWIWLTAAPKLLSDQQTIQFDDPQFTVHADNEIWNALQVLLHGRTEKLLVENSALRFGSQVEKLRSELLLKLKDPKITGDVQCSATNLSIALNDLVLADDEVRAVVQFKARLACSLPKLLNQ